MNREELNEMLNEMDPVERDLMLAADDAYDRLYAYKLNQKYGVTVECNPGGDRTKVVIDGVVMTQEQFAAWLMSKQLSEISNTLAQAAYDSSNDVDDEIELPSSENIPYDDLNGAIGSRQAVERFLRNKYNHYLAGGTTPNIVWEDNEAVVTNICWGRKR